MLRGRLVYTSINKEIVVARIGRGYPQRWVLSSLLWNFVMDELLCLLYHDGHKVHADDIVIHDQGKYVVRRLMLPALNIMTRWFEVKPDMMYKPYTIVVEFMITYVYLVWRQKIKQPTAVDKLRRVQRLACLEITGAMRITSTAALETFSNLPSLHLVMTEKARVAEFRPENSPRYNVSGKKAFRNMWRIEQQAKRIRNRFNIVTELLARHCPSRGHL